MSIVTFIFLTNTFLFGKLITKPRLHFRLRFLQIVIEGGIIMMYTIGQVSQMFDIPISTLRYYDKEGLFPDIQRTSGIRRFGEKELEAIRVIECLKKSGMEIKDIKQFMKWCTEGSKTYPKRLDLFVRQKAAVEMEIERLNRVLDMLKFKCWYYEEAIKDGTEDRITAMSPEEMPEEIRQAFLNAHR